MRDVFNSIIKFGLVPGLMVAMVALGIGMALRAEKEQRLSAWAGAGAGFVSFVIYATLRPGSEPPVMTESNAAAIIVTVAAAVFVFVVLNLLARFRRALLGMLTWFIIGTNTVSLYAYFFESSLRIAVVQLSLGSLLGVFVYLIFFADRFKRLFARVEPAL